MATNPVKAIREFCLGCSGDSPNEVKLCTVTSCPLYDFRFGKNPHRQRREMTEEQKRVLADRLREARKSHSSTVENDASEGEMKDNEP